jgi:DNA-directed RNA polymerase III subunit RPC11
MIFCPMCANMLHVQRDDEFKFSCTTCPYDYPIRGKQYVETNYMTRKKADDVLGGEDSWKNVDSVEGMRPETSGT